MGPLGEEPHRRWDRPIRMSAGVLASFLAASLCLAACGGAPGSVAPEGIFFPTVPRQDAYPAALITGALLEERSGCLFARAGTERWLLLWPDGYTARLAQGRIEVVNEDGTVVGIEGQRLSLGGGESNPAEVGGAASAHAWATG